MKCRIVSTLPILLLLTLSTLRADFAGGNQTNSGLPKNVELFDIPTSSPENQDVRVYLKKPSSYNPAITGKVYRVLVLCPYLNEEGMHVITNNSLVGDAETNGWFVVIPPFKGDTSEVHDPARCYYYPQEFSGKAVLDALDQISRKYPVDINHLLINGLSGGAQFTHRFALMIPNRVTALAINSYSWFDEPNAGAAKFPWLITIGEADPAFNVSVDFVSKLRNVGALPVFKSYIGMVHEGDERVSHFNDVFLSFYDKLTAGDLGKGFSMADEKRTNMVLTPKDMPFVGDSEDGKYYTNTPDNLSDVDTNSLIYFPSEEIARLWGLQDGE